jgi:predicted metal-dependent peptidase
MARSTIDPYLVWLIQNEPFYSTISRRMEKRESTSIPTAGVSFNKKGNIVLQYNPDFINELSFDEVIGVLKHEMLHIAFLHLTNKRMPGFKNEDQHQLFNIAADLAINFYIEDELPGIGVFAGTDKGGEKFSDWPKGKSAEAYLKRIQKEIEDQEDRCPQCGQRLQDGDDENDDEQEEDGQQGEGGEGREKGEQEDGQGGQGEGEQEGEQDEQGEGQGESDQQGQGQEEQQGQGGQGQEECDTCGQPKPEGGGEGISREGLEGEGMDVHDWYDNELSDEEQQLAEEKMKDALSEAEEEAVAKGWGSVPEEIRGKISASLSGGKVDWKKILRRFVTTKTTDDRFSSVRRVNRKYPGIHPGFRRERVPTIAVSVDQSGSISDHDLSAVATELNSLAEFVEFEVIPFDTDFSEEDIYTWEKGEKFDAIERVRCGGTNLDPATKYVNEEGYQGHIMFTDMQAQKPVRSQCPRLYLVPENSEPHFETEEQVVEIVHQNGE